MSYIKSTELVPGSQFIARCAFPNCKCKIIESSALPTDTIDIQGTPTMLRLSKKSATQEGNYFYKVTDVWAFDNVGVSKKIPDEQKDLYDSETESQIEVQRLLVCSDCDRGPIGFAAIGKDADQSKVENLKYYLSTDSILYELKP